MSEWLSAYAAKAATARHRAAARDELERERRRMKEHAWKADPATLTVRHQDTSSRIQFNDLPP
jgi:hypothetical protein